MESAPARLTSKPSWLISQLSVHVRRLVSDAFSEEGARGYHYRLLAALKEYGPSSQAALGRRCSMDRSDVTTALAQLADEEHVERSPDPAHGRRSLVTLTASGARRLQRLDRVLEGVQDELLAPLPESDRAALVALLGRLVDHHGAASGT
ncbi:MarR family winged helix-turn-helix transcriptional regulator [Streptomyces sp. NPDC048172]|uniref:MarR family winged helix-turn-helix transcriptional regulator n=1 Tax=Streptomyces sp. NPDC048172 TaxID=3365505 RepID=UPI0037128A2D